MNYRHIMQDIKYDNLRVNDRVQLRKSHPCGSDEWIVYRVGGDIGLQCDGCGRRVILPRKQFAKRLKRILLSLQDQDS